MPLATVLPPGFPRRKTGRWVILKKFQMECETNLELLLTFQIAQLLRLYLTNCDYYRR